jgi:uncharacterized membrane protein YgdD (TMEM256/DUF423 family)
MNNSQIGSIAAFLLAASVALGAFGSHGLKEVLSVERFEVYQIGVKYQFYHSLGLLLIFLLGKLMPQANFKTPALLMFIGLVVFCGTLYGIAIGEFFGFDWSFLGMITPIGGVLLLVSWLILGVRIYRNERLKLV